MQTTSTDNLFQSDAQLEKSAAREAKAARTANAGQPIQLGSKPLDMVIRRDAGADGEAYAWTAESGFVARKVNLKTGKTVHLYKGHTGPVTSLAFYSTQQLPTEILLTASWDKSIRAWDTRSRSLLSLNANAHTDFVKCLQVLPSLRILVSGGSDKDIRLWDLQHIDHQDWSNVSASLGEKSAGNDGETSPGDARQPVFKDLPCLGSLKGHHTRPIEALAWYSIHNERPANERICLWSADSMGRICIWEIWRNSGGELQWQLRHTWLAHETAIYELRMGDGEVWTSSADQLAILWSFNPDDPTELPVATLRLPHPYYVKTTLALEQVVPGSGIHFVLTGCTDEQIRVWDTSLLDPSEGAGAISKQASKPPVTTALNASEAYKDGKKPHGMVYELEGHYHEVVKLDLWISNPERSVEIEGHSSGTVHRGEIYVVSAGLDCTLRGWHLKDLLELAKSKERPEADERTEGEKATLKEMHFGREETPKKDLLTEEEEAELAELMGDD